MMAPNVEEVLTEKIAQVYWRLGVAARDEAEAFEKENPFSRSTIPTIMRYQTMINRQLFRAMNELQRLQRLRNGGECTRTTKPTGPGRCTDNLGEREFRSLSPTRGQSPQAKTYGILNQNVR